jgi:hypothetical protein
LHVERSTMTYAILSGWPSPTDSEVKRKVSFEETPLTPWLPMVEDVRNSEEKGGKRDGTREEEKWENFVG